MTFALATIGQVSITVDDVDAAQAFYRDALGLRELYRFGELLFLDAGGVRLYVQGAPPKDGGRFVPASSIVYFKVPEIVAAREALAARGVPFVDSPHLVAPMPDHDLWMTHFKDPAGNVLVLMCEAPKGWRP